jgi:hypothetical protein
MRNDGQILGMDGEVAARACEVHEPRFRLYRLLPGPAEAGFAPRWRYKIVSPNEIDWGAPGGRPRSAERCYDSYLGEIVERSQQLSEVRREFYSALAAASEANAGRAWDTVASIVGGLRWNSLPSSYDSVRALGVLATVRTGSLCLPSQIPATNLPHLVNSMLLEPRERRCWTHAFELLCRSKGLHELLATPSVVKKCERNRMESPSSHPIDGAAGPVFNVFFPEGAFYRLKLSNQPLD